MGSKSNAGSSRADKMANQVTAAQETYGKPAHLSRPVGGFTPSQLAGDITSAGGNVTFGGGQNVTRDYAQTALGQAGFNPNMIGGYGITPGDEKFSATELGNIGAMRDVLAGNIPGHLVLMRLPEWVLVILSNKISVDLKLKEILHN
mgnify:CR=1 FL=1